MQTDISDTFQHKIENQPLVAIDHILEAVTNVPPETSLVSIKDWLSPTTSHISMFVA